MALRVIRPEKPLATPVPSRMTPSATSAQGGSSAATAPVKIKGVRRILTHELIPFTRQLASMSAAGMPILPILETLRDQCADVNFRGVLETVTASVEGGAPLSDSISRYPQIFSESYVNLVIAGEQSGRFADILARLAAMLTSASRLRRKVKSAMTYPTVIISLALLMAAGLIQFVVPIFAEMFSGFGKSLPGLTQLMVDLSAGVKRWWYVIFPSIGVGVWLFLRWKKSPSGRYRFDEFMLNMPVFGELNRKNLISRLSRVLAEMLNAGVPVLNALRIAAAALGNQVLSDSVTAARREVEQGNQLSLALQGKPYLPMLMTRMVAAGERAGRVEEMLGSVADTYDEEVESQLATLTSLLEPILMIVLGVIIGTIVVAMFLPIFNMGQLAR